MCRELTSQRWLDTFTDNVSKLVNDMNELSEQSEQLPGDSVSISKQPQAPLLTPTHFTIHSSPDLSVQCSATGLAKCRL